MNDIACSNPTCSNTVEPFANDGDGEYRTEDEGGRCAACNASKECACCGERFECADPSDPDNVSCPDCRADVVPARCNHTDTTCPSCERY